MPKGWRGESGGTIAGVSRDYLREAKKAAKELGYGKAVIQQIDAAKSDREIERIMISARRKKFKMDEEF